jgi:hypothetical protein
MDATNGSMGNVKPRTIFNRKGGGIKGNGEWEDIIAAHVSQVVEQYFSYYWGKLTCAKNLIDNRLKGSHLTKFKELVLVCRLV